jgi:hypothetical protein
MIRNSTTSKIRLAVMYSSIAPEKRRCSSNLTQIGLGNKGMVRKDRTGTGLVQGPGLAPPSHLTL